MSSGLRISLSGRLYGGPKQDNALGGKWTTLFGHEEVWHIRDERELMLSAHTSCHGSEPVCIVLNQREKSTEARHGARRQKRLEMEGNVFCMRVPGFYIAWNAYPKKSKSDDDDVQSNKVDEPWCRTRYKPWEERTNEQMNKKVVQNPQKFRCLKDRGLASTRLSHRRVGANTKHDVIECRIGASAKRMNANDKSRLALMVQ